MQQILEGNFEYSEFIKLEPHVQQILFMKMRSELACLAETKGELEQKLNNVERGCPSLDLQISCGSGRYENDECEPQPNERMDTLSQSWEYNTGHCVTSRDSPDNHYTSWNHRELYAWSSDAGMETCQRRNMNYSIMNNNHGFWDRISSQLLLYRLCVMFGMPPPIEGDGYKVCWEVRLRHSDSKSILTLRDYKGAASVSFYGRTAASADALELINFLASYNMLHTYGNVIAGAQA